MHKDLKADGPRARRPWQVFSGRGPRGAGPPQHTTRADFLPFALPDITDRELDAVRRVLESGWLTTGATSREFESEFARRFGASHAVALNSCTAAMHLALEAIGTGPGDLVITTPFTFAASAAVVEHLGAVPVLADVDPQTLNIDPERVRAVLTQIEAYRDSGAEPEDASLRKSLAYWNKHCSSGGGTEGPRAVALLPVHFAGHPCDLSPLYELAKQHRLAIVQDAAHALPSRYRGQPIGSDLPNGVRGGVCFSFYATKTLTTGEGGMFTSADGALADRVRMMSLHGMSRDAWKRYRAKGSWFYEVEEAGFKCNLTDIASALGLVQLDRLEEMSRRRVAIARRYTEAFSQVPELVTPTEAADVRHSWHLYPIRLRLDRSQLCGRSHRVIRDRMIIEMEARKIGVSVHFIPLHLHPHYRDRFGYEPEDLEVAYRQFERVLSLPIYPKMTDDDVGDVIDAVGESLASALAAEAYGA